MSTNKYLKYFIYIFLLTISFIVLLSNLFAVNNDELFTMGLIMHSYKAVVSINELDVHPFLYYLFLKLFLGFTTFWTKSMIIKFFFARLLSLIFFSITFYVLLQIFSLLEYKINIIFQFILYFSFANIIFYSLFIRMYQLAIMLISIELYGILYFRYKHKPRGLFLVFLSLLLIFYTDYFSALFAGTLLFLEFIRSCYKKHIKESIQFFVTGIFDIIGFLPCLRYALVQSSHVASNGYSNFISTSAIGKNMYVELLGAITGENINSIKTFIIGLISLLVEIFLVIWGICTFNKRFKSFVTMLYLSFVIAFLPPIIFSYINHPMILWKYGFALFAIILFMLVFIIIQFINSCNNRIVKSIFFISLCIFLFLLSGKAFIGNIQSSKGNLTVIKSVKMFNQSHSNIKYLTTNSSNQVDTPLYYSLFCSRNKEIVINHMAIKNILGRNNKELINKMFPNMLIRSVSHKAYH